MAIVGLAVAVNFSTARSESSGESHSKSAGQVRASALPALSGVEGSQAEGETPAAQLEKGVFQQETAGDLDAAVKVYQQIVDTANANRRFVAEAQFRIGACYQKQGKKAEAEAAFRQVVASYPDQAELVAKARKELGEVIPTILSVTKDGGATGITLEKAWVLPAGLVILRCGLNGRVPFGEPPHLGDPSKNPWGLKPDEISKVIGGGQLILEAPEQTELVAEGGLAGRWACYDIFGFSPSPDSRVPVKLKYRTLLARTGGLGDAYFKAVLNDPSAWELYEFSIPTQPYLTDQIPEEIYTSPNLMQISRDSFTLALRRIVADYEKRDPARALEFLKAQGPHTKELLNDELERLTPK